MSKREQDLQLEEIRLKAKEYAKEKQETVIIFWDPVEGAFTYILESAAGSTPPYELISHY